MNNAKRTISAAVNANTVKRFDDLRRQRGQKNRAWMIERLMEFCLSLGSTGKALVLGQVPLTDETWRDALKELKGRRAE